MTMAEGIGELRMAMKLAHYHWPGTSLVEGALELMAEIRRTHPEQFLGHQGSPETGEAPSDASQTQKSLPSALDTTTQV